MVTFDQEKTAFYHEMGRALGQWAILEEGLCHLFMACVGGTNGAALYSAYWSVENFRSRLKMIDSALRENRRKAEAIKSWSKCHERLSTESKIRNKIAHWPPMSFQTARAGRRYGIINRADMMLPYHRSYPKDFFSDVKPPKDGIFVRELIQARARWHALSLDTHAIEIYVGDPLGKAKPPASEQPLPKQPDLQQLVSQIRSRIVPREKSSHG